jgi:hypothetical protein
VVIFGVALATAISFQRRARLPIVLVGVGAVAHLVGIIAATALSLVQVGAAAAIAWASLVAPSALTTGPAFLAGAIALAAAATARRATVSGDRYRRSPVPGRYQQIWQRAVDDHSGRFDAATVPSFAQYPRRLAPSSDSADRGSRRTVGQPHPRDDQSAAENLD